MAAGGGGAWKVAYADFVTAMMAFFLVMWIVSQDKKIKEAVAHYFMDPMGYFPMGSSKTTAKGGSMFQSIEQGHVSDSQDVTLGRGRATYTDETDMGYATHMVGEWIRSDADMNDHWLKQAEECRNEAEMSETVRSKKSNTDDVAKSLLTKRLKSEVMENIPGQVKGIYQDMLYAALGEVQWDQIAEELIED
jgi:chemotaxis protein MotB